MAQNATALECQSILNPNAGLKPIARSAIADGGSRPDSWEPRRYLVFGPSRMCTAHVTGNLVLPAASLVGNDPIELAGLLSLPVFVLALCVARLLAGVLTTIGYSSLRPLLLLQFMLITTFLALAVVERLGSDTAAPLITIGGLLGVSAMAIQNSLVQVSLEGAPTTAVMTTQRRAPHY
jgi:uncharacterized membrane protein YoaK (UPF0700 family)